MNSKVVILILMISSLSIACDQTISEQPVLKSQLQEELPKIEHHNIEIFEIDQCQYIIYKEKDGTNLAYGYMAHKGNCENPVHSEKLLLSTEGRFDVDTEQLITDIIENQ